ncbi:SMP-30/gluconolactonase/LRE family protein [Falsirhodobacter sp. 20TX0035]|uniref:SMP-30/gluconolactonase/LRE family protein n=1 Tax=Falsirhodobacter sp. 20TX0035 TaxID=3022019 RepID=UPI003FA60EF8
MSMIHSHTRCELGEGAFWHPKRAEFFWFDILSHRFYGEGRHWDWDEPVSAAGWIDLDRLLVASASALWVLHLGTGHRHRVQDLEADRPDTRSNDGKADPWGGFWIGTMGRKAEAGQGAIYRWYGGELRRLHGGITIPNAICFDAPARVGYFADTAAQTVFRQSLDPATGWPVGELQVFLDLTDQGLFPDGATVDAEGRLWLAQWGASRVACYGPDAGYLGEERFPATQISCPAFGGVDMTELFATSALEGMDEEARADEPHGGKTFRRTARLNDQPVRGVPEPAVVLQG